MHSELVNDERLTTVGLLAEAWAALSARNRQSRRGVAAVELAVVAPVLLTLLLGLWEVGRLVEVQQVLANAVREGARQASTGQKTNSQVSQAVLQYVSDAGLSNAGAVVTVTNLTSGNDAAAANQLDHFQVQVTIPFNSVRWVLLNQITNVSQLSASADWYSMRDIPITINQNIPLQ